MAVRALVYLSHGRQGRVASPKHIAEHLRESPTYMAKVLRLLVRAGILRAEKGVKGGVFLSRRAADITFLSIYEATQGSIAGGYCREACDPAVICAYHQASLELEQAVVGVLSRWSLEDLASRVRASVVLPRGFECVMAGGKPTGTSDGTALNRMGEVTR